MGERIYWSLSEAFGAEPKLFQSAGSPFQSIAYVYGPPEALNRDLLPQARSVFAVKPYSGRGDVLLATDNWPYLYLEKNWIPRFSLVVVGLAMLLSVGIVAGVDRSLRRPNLHFFFLGAGFMLLETRSVTQMALLFGSTWNVNAVVFISILLAILATNWMVQAGLAPRREFAYAFLFASLGLGYLFPFEKLLSLAFLPRLLASGVAVGAPVAFASVIFSTAFKEEKRVSQALGSNLLGVVFGGALEYTSNIWGLNHLYLVAMILYFISLLPGAGWLAALARSARVKVSDSVFRVRQP